jgi:hypothetical protein
MRPGQQQQKQRSRGRNNNGGGGSNNNNNNNNNNQRKGQNPLTRSYDSSGPDVKVRGTAQSIAEKYMTLARDATSSGDRVMAENYLQHAEHYNRIIAAAQAMYQERFQRDERQEFSSERQDYNEREDDDNDSNDNENSSNGTSDSEMQPEQQAPRREHQQQAPRREHQQQAPRRNEHQVPQQQPQPIVIDASTPQPVFEGTPAEVQIEQETSAQENAEQSQPRRRAPARPRRTPRQPKAEGAVAADTPAPVDEPAE